MTVDELITSRLSEIQYKRWQRLVKRIGIIDDKLGELQRQIHLLNKQRDKLYIEMRKLWMGTE